MNTDRIDFAPRIGVAYHLFKPLVVRGGYGVFHQFINRIGSESLLQQNPPFLGSWNIAQAAGSTYAGVPTGFRCRDELVGLSEPYEPFAVTYSGPGRHLHHGHPDQRSLRQRRRRRTAHATYPRAGLE